MVGFRCTVCGTANQCAEQEFSRESAVCQGCGSTVRMRAAIAALSLGLYGRVYDIDHFPRRPRLRGLGMSDWDGYAVRLRRVLDYKNTHVQKRPKLDITAIPRPSRLRDERT